MKTNYFKNSIIILLLVIIALLTLSLARENNSRQQLESALRASEPLFNSDKYYEYHQKRLDSIAKFHPEQVRVINLTLKKHPLEDDEK